MESVYKLHRISHNAGRLSLASTRLIKMFLYTKWLPQIMEYEWIGCA